jgi:hypothetical protein
MGLPGLTDPQADLAATLAASRATLLEELGDEHELTFVTGPGELGDDLVRAGTRSLLKSCRGRWRSPSSGSSA